MFLRTVTLRTVCVVSLLFNNRFFGQWNRLTEMLIPQVHKFTKHFIKSLNVPYSCKCYKFNHQRKLIRKDLFDQFNDLIEQSLNQNRQPTATEWHELRKKLLELSMANKSAISIDMVILEKCFPDQLDTGKSYIKYLKESGRGPAKGTLAKFLILYHRASKHGVEITANDQQDIIDMCKWSFLEKTLVFDSTIGSAVIQGLVLTADWRKSIEVLRTMSKPRLFARSCLVQRAFQEGDVHLAWSLLNPMAAQYPALCNEVFMSYIGYCENDAGSFTENIDKILIFIKENRILVTREVINEFSRVFSRFNYSCSVTTVSKQGECHSCRKRLLHADLTDDEMNSLSIHFMDKVMIGDNLFDNSTPKELDSFKAFIDKTGPYDCVLDGLNTAYSSSSDIPTVQANVLASVIKHFVDRNKTVLVIGRKHMMLDWPEAQTTYIRDKSKLFLTEDSSQDDPFLVYSALTSGLKTAFVSRDLMRDHASKLDKELKAIFQRWQQQHQHIVKCVADNGEVTFQDRIEFDMNAQEVDKGCWHIPFEDGSRCTFQENYFELWEKWLCVEKN